MPGLALRNITKRFGDLLVLDDISLEINDGELLVLLGPSGCGKSTVLRLIAGLEEVDQGDIFIDGKRVEKLRPRDRNVALVFQNYSLYPHMTIARNLAFPLKVAKMPSDEIRQRVQAVAEMLGLEARLGDRPGQLSGGQRQRVALGRAIIREPSVFLLDEPLSNLDADLRVRMRREIVSIQRRQGKPMIHVTHDQAEALTMADRIALLNEGRVEQLGTPEELYRQPATRFVAEFIGTPKISMVPAAIDDRRVIPFGFMAPTALLSQVGEAGEFVIGVRPEAVELCADGEYEAEVTACEYLGDHVVVTINYQGHDLVSSKAPMPPPETGRQIRFTVNQKALLYFRADTGVALSIDN